MLVYSLILSLLLVGAYAAPTEAPAKSVVDAKSTDGQKSAATLDEQNKARTYSLLNNLIHKPSYGFSSYPASYPVPITYTSYQQPFVSSVHAFPVNSLHVPPVHVAPAPVHVSAPVHAAPMPVVSQTTYTKPVVSYTPTVVKKPTYTVSQQVLHQPVITEVQQVIRRPVIAELQEVIHKPVFLEYQQAFKLPTHTVHIVKKPTYSSIQQETVQKPIVLNSEQYHVVQKPSSQVLQLPPQYVQAYSNEVVHVPSVHHQTETQTTVHHPPAVTVHQTPAVQPVLPAVQPALPAVSYLPSYDYSGASFGSSGSSLIGSESSFSSLGSSFGGYGSSIGGYGSSIGGYGSSIGGYGSSIGGYGSSFGGYGSSIGGLGSSGYEDASVYISPSTCRGGDCQVKRDADGQEFVVMPNSGYANQQMIPTSSSSYTPNVMPASTISMPQTYWSDYDQSFKNTQDGGNSQQQTQQARASNEFGNDYFPQDFENNLPSKDSLISRFAGKLFNNPDFHQIVQTKYEEAEKEGRAAETQDKVMKIVSSLSDEQINALKKTLDESKGSSSTPASVQPAADQKTEAPKS